MDANELAKLKTAINTLVIGIAGVTGTSISTEAVTVYLERADQKLRDQVQHLIHGRFPDVIIRFIVTGMFRPL